MRTIKMPIAARALAAVGATVTMLCGGESSVAQGLKCLDNNGVFNVDAGATYADAAGVWVCDPGKVGATAGGWVRVPVPPPSAVTPMPSPTATPTAPSIPRTVHPPAPIDGDGRLLPFAFWIAGATAALIAPFVGAGLLMVRGRRRMTGYLNVQEVRRVRP